MENLKTLVLNADFKPLSNLPLSLYTWQQTVTSVIRERVIPIHYYDGIWIRSPSYTMQLPSVVALKDYVKTKDTVTFNRYNIYLRDDFTCQYCEEKFQTTDLTFDHMIPKYLGGVSSWDNIVTSCRTCNQKKGNKLCEEAGMFPKVKPYEPSKYKLSKGLNSRYEDLHHSWEDFLYWDSDLE